MKKLSFKADFHIKEILPLDKLGISMKVPAQIYASEKLLQSIWKDQSLEQLVNTATLPGVYKYTLAMPDV
ncbi:RtcB family protein, partial [Patescibacteria group bacterium]|nr:RtcB family protein [Patescibacteria group bacterium]